MSMRKARPSRAARLTAVFGAFLFFAAPALPNGQNTYTNWPTGNDAYWVSLTNHITWCHRALVDRYAAAGLNTNLVHKPTYLYPFYDYRQFLSNVQSVCSYFVCQTNLGADGTFNDWFDRPTTNYVWTWTIWSPTSTRPSDFLRWTFTNLLEALSSNGQMAVRFPDTVAVTGRVVVVPGWQVGQMNQYNVTIDTPPTNVVVNQDRWRLDENTLRLWQDAVASNDIPSGVAAAISSLMWTAASGYFTNTVTVSPTNAGAREIKDLLSGVAGYGGNASGSWNTSEVPESAYWTWPTYLPVRTNRVAATPDWNQVATNVSGSPRWIQQWFNCTVSSRLDAVKVWYDVTTFAFTNPPVVFCVQTNAFLCNDYWTRCDISNTTRYAVSFRAPTNLAGTAESYTRWSIKGLGVSDTDIGLSLSGGRWPFNDDRYRRSLFSSFFSAEQGPVGEWYNRFWPIAAGTDGQAPCRGAWSTYSSFPYGGYTYDLGCYLDLSPSAEEWDSILPPGTAPAILRPTQGRP